MRGSGIGVIMHACLQEIGLDVSYLARRRSCQLLWKCKSSNRAGIRPGRPTPRANPVLGRLAGLRSATLRMSEGHRRWMPPGPAVPAAPAVLLLPTMWHMDFLPRDGPAAELERPAHEVS